MPKLRMMHNGCSLSFAQGVSDRDMNECQKHNKTENRGWTMATTRNLTTYLMRLNFTRIPGTPYAVTLTIPADSMNTVTPRQLHAMLASWIRRQQHKHGLLHYYWLIEFTAMGTPHIHMTIWCEDTTRVYNRHTRQHETMTLPPITTQTTMLTDWVRLCTDHGIPSSLTAQNFRPIDDTPEGWLAYTAKHSARGLKHYQRRLDNMPSDWRQHPGAMWGHDRQLTTQQAAYIDLPMNKEAFWTLRRQLRKRLEQQARGIANPRKRGRAIAATRRMLKRPLTGKDQKQQQWMEDNDLPFLPVSAFMGVTAWLSPQAQQELVEQLASKCPHLIGRPTRQT
ncbi:hypothetical protein KIH79_05455 [Bifidobacterium sp. 82T10]|uniref:Replication-associated protein ORF2/G2P domain-containing protein n=1 Tax=Bifidobacterium miconis TaxID=2834435 RepID=A0ABS6WEV4_9BIFI|nr:hypothetical protein [Bifidobacterium miconis]MBW3092397.1 hypothetical protein [Bifidobacterium miconis]